MTGTTHLARLQSLLRDLFQFELSDLDFGLYRLLHLKRAEIEAFLTEQLPRQVDEGFASVAGQEQEALGHQLDDLARQVREQIAEDAITPTGEPNPAYAKIRLVQQYQTLRGQLAAIQATDSHKAEIFNHLYSFFSRYYEDGDFIPRRRYGARESYAVPYDGQEVFFHWANRDQHYVKTAETFKDYTFRVETLGGAYQVRFVLAEATTARDNAKGDRRFFFPRPDLAQYDAVSRQFRLPFEYRLPTAEEVDRLGKNSKMQSALLEQAVKPVLAAIPDPALSAVLAEDQRSQADREAKKPELPLLLKRLQHFSVKNSSDFFIHKNLRNFLRRELEFYLKDQVLHLEDLEGDFEARRRLLRVLRRLGEQVIEFLAQIEEAQKRLFEKKKFVLRADYLIPIQHVPRACWSEILASPAQVAQWQEWFAIQPEAVNEGFLEAHPTVVVDTRHLGAEFTCRLLESLPFEDLEEATDGLLVYGENYQALRLLGERYREQLRCIYIDPPYNTSENTFLYKNLYKNSSWAAMIQERLFRAQTFLRPGGVIECAIDDTEAPVLRFVMDSLFGEKNRVSTIAIEVNPAGQNLRPNTPALSHDYCFVYALNIELMKMLLRELTEEERAAYKEKDKKGYFLWDNLRRRGGNSRPTDRPGQWFPLYIDHNTKQVSVDPLEGAEERWPIDPQGEQRIWRVNPAGARSGITSGDISVIEKADRLEIVKKSRMPKGKKPKTFWKESKYSATTHGTKLLIDILGKQNFSYPKSLHLVMECLRYWCGNEDTVIDFFAGSGTTGHAVIGLNREDEGDRKFILVEMGEYFDTVLLPRIAKIIYSPEWKQGQPKRLPTPDEVVNTPRLVKVLRLESYEDALHNLATSGTQEKVEVRETAYREALGADEYRLRYLVKLQLEASETLLNLSALEHPFSYTLEILTDEGPRRQPVDLIETFNYLYGLRVRRLKTWTNPADKRIYRAVQATDRDQRRQILVVWRDMADLDPQAERHFLEARLQEMASEGRAFDQMLINGDTVVKGFESLDGLFKRLMTADEGA